MSDGGCGLGGILGAPDSRFLKICGACGRPQYGSEPSVPASHPTAESAVSPRGACRRFQLASRGGRYTVLSRAVGATRSGHNTARTPRHSTLRSPALAARDGSEKLDYRVHVTRLEFQAFKPHRRC